MKSKSGASERAALGFRAHSGWAALVAVAGPLSSPVVIIRRRVELADDSMPRQPYHAAEKLDLREATALIRHCADRASLLARQALREAVAEVNSQGFKAAAVGILASSGRTLPSLPAILASHALIHTAEGELYRNALARARELPVTRIKEREILASAESVLGLPAIRLQQTISDLGKALGPPWTQDQKLAALAAWLSLAG